MIKIPGPWRSRMIWLVPAAVGLLLFILIILVAEGYVGDFNYGIL